MEVLLAWHALLLLFGGELQGRVMRPVDRRKMHHLAIVQPSLALVLQVFSGHPSAHGLYLLDLLCIRSARRSSARTCDRTGSRSPDLRRASFNLKRLLLAVACHACLLQERTKARNRGNGRRDLVSVFLGLQTQKIPQSLWALRKPHDSHSWLLAGYSSASCVWSTIRKSTLAAISLQICCLCTRNDAKHIQTRPVCAIRVRIVMQYKP